MLGAMLSLLGGCSQVPDRINPVEWWHGLQGGAIAEQRPPPPGADQGYPNLASVPAKPASPDLKLHQQIADSLVAARAQAQYAAAQAPLANASPPAISSAGGAAPGGGSAPPPAPAPSSEVAGASLAAASAPPAPPVAPPALPPLPMAPRSSGPGGAPAAAAQAAAPLAPPPEADVPGPVAPDANPPSFALEPPPPPLITGAPAAAAAVGSAASPTIPKPPAGPAQPKQRGATVPIAFERGSAVLPSVSRDALRVLAQNRQKAIVWVTGFGEAASVDPASQSAALTLAFARAQVMAAALTHAGVPGYYIRVAAEASGRGGAARLVE